MKETKRPNRPTGGTRMRSFGTSGRLGHDSSGFYGRRMYEEPKSRDTRQMASTGAGISVPSELETDVVHHHSSEAMPELPDGSVHLMVTSPPYNVGKDYDDDVPMNEYLEMLNRVWRETYRVLVPGGRACINIANVGRKPYLPLNHMIAAQALDAGFLMRGEIIWNKGASAGASCAWGSWRSAANPVLRDTHEYILVFCKEGFSRADGAGRESTIGRDEFLECTKSIWSMPTESAKRTRHPAPFPVQLPLRLIQLYTFSQDVVLDPFMGSGTTAVAAVGAGRKWVGYETSSEYIRITQERLQREAGPPEVSLFDVAAGQATG